MSNIFYLLVIIIVITAVVFLVTQGEPKRALKRALWTFIQLVGGMFILSLLVHILTNV